MALRVSIVSYLNSIPFLHGLRKGFSENELEISLDIPSVCAEKLANGAVDIGLIPVATLSSLPQAEVFSDYCIACDGVVGSVLLLSEKPIDEISTILLDYQSRTSVQLVKVLMKGLWKKEVTYTQATPGYEAFVTGSTAGVVIGDRALEMAGRFPFTYDLGKAWKDLTGLPFVFAAWATTRTLEKEFVKRFNQALKDGLALREELSIEHASKPINAEMLLDYWTDKIRYELGERQQSGMNEFLRRLE